MAKYHIASDGMAKPCAATVKPCPLGAADVHGEFETSSQAQKWAERKLELETMSASMLDARVARRVSSALKGRDERWGVVPVEEVKATMAGVVRSVTPATHAEAVAVFTAIERAHGVEVVRPYLKELNSAAVAAGSTR